MERLPVTQRAYSSTNKTMYCHLSLHHSTPCHISQWVLSSLGYVSLSVSLLSSDVSELEQQGGPARWAGITQRDYPGPHGPGRNRDNGNAWGYSRGGPEHEREAGMTNRFQKPKEFFFLLCCCCCWDLTYNMLKSLVNVGSRLKLDKTQISETYTVWFFWLASFLLFIVS